MFMCVFANNVPPPIAVLLWDLALVFGRTRVVFGATLAVLEMVGVELLCCASHEEALQQVMLAVTLFRHLPGVDAVVRPSGGAEGAAASGGAEGGDASGDATHTCRGMLRSALFWALHFKEDELASLRDSMLERLAARERRVRLRLEMRREEAQASKEAALWNEIVAKVHDAEEHIERALRLIQVHTFLESDAVATARDGAIAAGERAVDHLRALLLARDSPAAARAGAAAIGGGRSSSSAPARTAPALPRSSSGIFSMPSPNSLRRPYKFVQKLVGKVRRKVPGGGGAAVEGAEPGAGSGRSDAEAAGAAAWGTASAPSPLPLEESEFAARIDSEQWRRKRARQMHASIRMGCADDVAGLAALGASSGGGALHDEALLAATRDAANSALEILRAVTRGSSGGAAAAAAAAEAASGGATDADAALYSAGVFVDAGTVHLATSALVEVVGAVAAAQRALAVSACATALAQRLACAPATAPTPGALAPAPSPREILLALILVERFVLELAIAPPLNPAADWSDVAGGVPLEWFVPGSKESKCSRDESGEGGARSDAWQAACARMIALGVAQNARECTELYRLLASVRDHALDAFAAAVGEGGTPHDALRTALRVAVCAAPGAPPRLLAPEAQRAARETARRDAVARAVGAAQQMETMLRGEGATRAFVWFLRRREKRLAKEMSEWGNSRRRSIASIRKLVGETPLEDEEDERAAAAGGAGRNGGLGRNVEAHATRLLEAAERAEAQRAKAKADEGGAFTAMLMRRLALLKLTR